MLENVLVNSGVSLDCVVGAGEAVDCCTSRVGT